MKCEYFLTIVFVFEQLATEINCYSRYDGVNELVNKTIAVDDSNDPFMVINVDMLVDQHRLWRRMLPQVNCD